MSKPRGVFHERFPGEEVPRHMAVLEFPGEQEGRDFRDWWNGRGHEAFEAWRAAKDADEGEPD